MDFYSRRLIDIDPQVSSARVCHIVNLTSAKHKGSLEYHRVSEDRLAVARHLERRKVSQTSNCLEEGVRTSRVREFNGAGKAAYSSIMRF